MGRERSMITKRTIYVWRVFKIRKKLEPLGWVKALAEADAIEAAMVDYRVPES